MGTKDQPPRASPGDRPHPLPRKEGLSANRDAEVHCMIGKHTNGNKEKSQTQQLAVSQTRKF